MRKKTAPVTHPSFTQPTSEQKSPASVRADSTPNSKAVSEDAVRLRAYQKWQAGGKPSGDGVKFWLEAETELLQAK